MMDESPAHPALIVQRYRLEKIAGHGGLGTVYRAYDTVAQRLVALKLLHVGHRGRGATPFAREAQWLAALDHPGIVAYLGHGETESGQPYLVMEYLEGEDLAQRLLEGPLRVVEVLTLLRHVAAALAVAHRQQIVHGDLKPSNLFLRAGAIAGVTLLDFGGAHSAALPLSMHGGGTPNYLAPEVARAQPDVDARADIFSLGCLVYECLTGEPPFVAEHVTAVLAKTVFEEAPPVQQRRPEVPAELAALLGRMLAKDPAGRPRDAAALLDELAALSAQVQAQGAAPRDSMSSGSQRLLTVIVASGVAEPAHDTRFAALQRMLGERGAQLEGLANQAVLAAFLQPPGGEAADHAEQAVRGALLIKETWPQASVVVATGRGVLRQHLPMGEVVNRAMGLLRTEGDQALIQIDAMTSELIKERFAVREHGAELYCVVGERDLLDTSRLLLGQPTPCVGRDSELANLDGALAACIDRQAARVVVVTAPPGMGKSRLRHEFLRRLGTRAHALTVLMGRCDPMRAGSPYALLSQALQRLGGLGSITDPTERRHQLIGRLALNLAAAEAPHLTEFLGELCGIASGEPTPRMRAARNDPKIMTAQLSQVWVDFLRAECAQKPVLFIMEDLHWGDALTVALMDTALRELHDQPLFVLVLGRPEMEETFPSLFSKRAPQRVRLGRLSKNASRQLVRHALGAELSPEQLTGIVDQAAGNALYLEELIRATVEHKHAEPTHSILGILQARLLRLEPALRQFLRAASIFGEAFYLRGVSYLLAKEGLTPWAEAHLTALVAAEWIERPPENSSPQGHEYRFLHALLSNAAYSLLTDADRQAGHRLAGEYLQTQKEVDPMVLAGHFQRGGDLARALPYYILAAEQALAGSDLAGARARVECGLACSPQGEALGSLRAVQLAAAFWQDGWSEAVRAGREATALLPPGSMRWCRAAAIMLPMTNLLGDHAAFSELAAQVDLAEPSADARAAFLQAAAYLVIVFSLGGQPQAAARFRERIQRYQVELSADDAAIHGIIKFSEVVYARQLGRDPYLQCQLAREAAELSEQAADLRNALFVKPFWGIGRLELGDAAGAEQVLREALALSAKLNEPLLGTNVRVHLEMLLLSSGRPEQVREALASARASVESVGINPLLLGQSLTNLAHALLLRGELPAAEKEARRACAALVAMPGHYNLAESILIRTLQQLGRTLEAGALARVALQRLATQPCSGYAELTLRLAATEVLLASSDVAAGERALADTQHELYARAACLPQPADRERFLHGVPTHQRLQELCAARGMST